MYTIVTDSQITRNRSVHHVISPDDLVVFTSPKIAKCIEYLGERGVKEFYMDYGEYRTRLHLSQFPHGHEITLMGWLNRTEEAKAKGGASPQAASHIASL